MLQKIQIQTIFFGIFLGFCTIVYGWGNRATHPAITEKSSEISIINDYLKNQIDLTNGTQTKLEWDFSSYLDVSERIKSGGAEPSKTNRTVLEWIKIGSNIEDEDGHPFLPSIRSRHHFYDPVRNAGLDNRTDHPIGSWGFRMVTDKFGREFDATGQSSLIWSTDGTSTISQPFYNYYSWQQARFNFYNAFKAPSQEGRENWLALAFLDLGHVIHLIEDIGVPAHTRNDFIIGHLQYEWPNKIGNPLESWTEKLIEDNNGNIPLAWLTDWTSQPKVFDKISKYWDTELYTGAYIGIPASEWGLAEQTNYQFISTSTFPGCTGTLYQFPNPSTSHLGTDLQVSVPDGIKLYFNGSSYGVSHIARKSYTRFFADETGLFHEAINNTITPDDDKVYQDYIKITIPRTIDFASGLINYFFPREA